MGPLASIPFIAGQWSLRHQLRRLPIHHMVSIPFIAGQWSLLNAIREDFAETYNVSIPFIAGQWTLLRSAT